MYIPEKMPHAVVVTGGELLPALAALTHLQRDGRVPESELTTVEADNAELLEAFGIYQAALERGLVWEHPSAIVRNPELLRDGLELLEQKLTADTSLKGLRRFGREQRTERARRKLVGGMLTQLSVLDLGS